MHSYMRSIVRSVAVVAVAASCMSSDEILSVQDPDIINPSDVQSLAGANAVRLGALARLNAAYTGVESYVQLGGLLTDEWRTGDTFVDRDNIDKRSIVRENGFATTASRTLHRARVMAALGSELMVTYNSAAPNWQLAELYFVMGFVENAIAETYCNGVPIAQVVNGFAEARDAMTTTDIYALALAHVDSGLAIVSATGAGDTARVRQSLMITRGRILMNQGNYATASTAVTAVPTTHRHFMRHSLTTNQNQTWSLNNSLRRYNLADVEGGVGMNFITAADPRVPNCAGGTAPCTAAGVSATGTRPFDNTTTFPFRAQLLWTTNSTDVEIVSGVEARLIEAYAQIMAGNSGTGTLNTLRTTGGVAGLPATLVDPGTQPLRLDQLYRERAFWLFGKGHRLGDMRRLMRLHARAENTVWPNGAHHKGGTFGADLNFPIPQVEDNNAAFTTPQANNGRCIDRLP